MPSVKKFAPVLYPKDQSMSREWVIKYSVLNYKTGKVDKRGYKGLLNLLPTKEDRLNEAQKYMRMIKEGIELPKYTGLRSVPVVSRGNNFASIFELLKQWYHLHEYEGEHKTQLDRKSKVKIFCEWLQQTGFHSRPVGAFNADDARTYINHLKKKGNASNTIIKTRIVLSQAWAWFVQREFVSKNVWKEVRPPKKVTVSFKRYTTHVEQTILQHMPDFNLQTFIAHQLCYYGFIRVEELRKLKCENIDWERGTINLPASITKANKTRTKVLYIDMLMLLLKNGYREQPADYYLFTTSGKPGKTIVGHNYFSRWFKRFRDKFGIDVSFKFYAAKHTGNDKLRQTTNAIDIQKHNGHASLQHTQHYNNDVTWQDLQYLFTKFPKFGQPVVREGSVDVQQVLRDLLEQK